MKKRWAKTLALVLAAVLCMGLLSGCSIASAIMEQLTGGSFSAQELVQGNLDLLYLNQYTDEYLESVHLTAEEADLQYEDGIAVEADYFVRHFELVLDQCPEGTEERIKELYRKIYALSKYEVGEQTQNGDTYLVPLTVYPIDVIMNIDDEALADFGEDWSERIDSGEFDDITEEEFDAIFESEWAECVIGLAEEGLATAGYMDPETISVQVTPDSDGVYTISENDFNRIDSLIIAY